MRGLFDTAEDVKIEKEIALIELFAGYGSQLSALKRIGAKVHSHLMCEFDKYAVKSFNAIHGTDYGTSDVRELHGADLNITEKDKYCYMLTYSFPCTDLSVGGKMMGMSKADWEAGNSTRSGLLWEVERILKECEKDKLPDILFMENVPQVCSDANMKDFNAWQLFLENLGYHSFLQILNAKDYGIPQNRERAFMFSFLDDVYYEFPKSIELTACAEDLLDLEVDEKYYVNTKSAKQLIDSLDREVLEREAEACIA